MTNMDLETGAVNDEAIKQLNEFQQKLLPTAATATPAEGATSPGTPAVAGGQKNDYTDLIK